MATKSVIEIEVSDAQFKDFFQLFESYKEKLEGMPDDWKKVNDAASEGTEAFAATAGAVLATLAEAAGHASALTKNLREAADAQKEFGSASHTGANNLKSMAKDAKALGESIFGIGKFLFKLGAIGVGAVAGSFFGIDALANSAVANQRAGRSLGMTTGQTRAFNNDLAERYIDQGTLSNVADAQNSYVGRVWLARATGMSQSAVQSTDAGSLAAQLAIKAHDWWASTPESQHTDANLMATGFTQSGMSLADVRRQGNTPRAELESAYANYRKDAPGLSQSNSSVNALYDFTRSLKNAGDHLEIDLANKLSQLNKSGALSNFVTSLEKDAEILINGVLSESNLKAIEGGLKEFADYLGSPDFRADVKGFADDLGKLAKMLHWVTDPLPTDVTHPKPGSAWDTIDQVGDDVWDGMKHVGSVLWSPVKHAKALLNESPHPGNNPGNLRSAAGVPTVNGFANFQSQQDGYAAMAALLGSYPAKHHADTIASVINTWAPPSDHNDTAAYIADVSKWTGFAPNQKLNLSNADTIAKLMSAMVRQEHGWKVSPEQIKSDIAQAHWKTPGGSSDDVKNLMRQIASQQQKPVNISVTNKSGTNVAVSANAGSI